jgi:acyl carrier protein
MQNPQVVEKVVATIFDAVNIRSIDRQMVKTETALGPQGLGLDSVDILEVVVAVEHEFKIKITDRKLGQTVFASIGSIAEFVLRHSPLYAVPS